MQVIRNWFLKNQSLTSSPPIYFGFFASILHGIKAVTGFGFRFDFYRYYQANRLKISPIVISPNQSPPIEILFVSTRKDFEVLPFAVNYAMKATSQHELVGVYIVVPESDVELCQSIFLDTNVNIISENQYISDDEFKSISQRFSKRSGWVIQQILKVRFVGNSKSAGVLIVDSDTLLLRPRFWFSLDGSQSLMPTWEYHTPYYVFLNKVGISSLRPKYTFVSHHMLMQPEILRKALAAANWNSDSDLIEAILRDSNENEDSPFCIEYELYAQYLIRSHIEKVKLDKWCNIGISRKKLPAVELKQATMLNKYEGYFSISLHSYLE
jgi:hypothetical protein